MTIKKKLKVLQVTEGSDPYEVSEQFKEWGSSFTGYHYYLMQFGGCRPGRPLSTPANIRLPGTGGHQYDKTVILVGFFGETMNSVQEKALRKLHEDLLRDGKIQGEIER